jgi:hypothetical protein
MSPGRNDSPGGKVPFGFSVAIADLAILMSPERNAHPGWALGMLVSARRSLVSEPIENSKSKHYDNENFKKLIHNTIQSKPWLARP